MCTFPYTVAGRIVFDFRNLGNSVFHNSMWSSADIDRQMRESILFLNEIKNIFQVRHHLTMFQLA